jgi:hypothetical protein
VVPWWINSTYFMVSSFAGMYCGEDERTGPESTP